MHLHTYLLPTILTLPLPSTILAARKPPEKILLSNVKTLTLRKDLLTSHNRVSAIPQLKCVSGTARGLFEVDMLRCKNQGSDYSPEDIQWTCTASLPPEFKLGSTDVICEGFASPDDPYVLKGSCGVEYRLLLTERGEQRYGRTRGGYPEDLEGETPAWITYAFWVALVAVLAWIIWAAFIRDDGVRLGGAAGNPWEGGGGGGGGGNDPPPPYSRFPSQPKWSSRQPQGQEAWRPGFWSGALGGAAAGYMAGRSGQQQQQRDNGWGRSDPWEGSSRTTRSSGSSGSSFSSSRHESSGFGSTSRR
ncbi:MAG: hypothetical protein Q9191_003021 [Dirinaria sp. TL-2023a]